MGSILDTILAILVGILFGINTFELVKIGIPGYFSNGEKIYIKERSILFPGLTVSISLLIQVAGIGLNGNQWLLFLVIPFLGLFVIELMKIDKSENAHISLFLQIVLLVGGITSLPLAMVDSDELMMITTFGSGELMEVALHMCLCTLVLEITLLLVYLILGRELRKLPRKEKSERVAAGFL